MKSVDGQVMIVVLPDVFRAVVICETCRATIATALACGWTVATRDNRSFPRIPGLAVEIWK